MFFLTAILTAMCGASISYGAWQASSYLYDVCRGYSPRYKYKLTQSVDYLEQTLTENNVKFDIINHESDPSVLIDHAHKLATKLKVLDFCKTLIMVIDISSWSIGRQLTHKELEFLRETSKRHYERLVEVYELLESTTYLGMYDTLIRVVHKVYASLRNNKPIAAAVKPIDNTTAHPIIKAETILTEIVQDLIKKIKQP